MESHSCGGSQGRSRRLVIEVLSLHAGKIESCSISPRSIRGLMRLKAFVWR